MNKIEHFISFITSLLIVVFGVFTICILKEIITNSSENFQNVLFRVHKNETLTLGMGQILFGIIGIGLSIWSFKKPKMIIYLIIIVIFLFQSAIGATQASLLEWQDWSSITSFSISIIILCVLSVSFLIKNIKKLK